MLLVPSDDSVFASSDPSMTVRTDIAGKYSNHHYAYEAGDMAHCEWPSAL